VVMPAAWLYIPSFIEIRSGVSEPQGVKIWPFPLLWLVAFTTACTAVMLRAKNGCWHSGKCVGHHPGHAHTVTNFKVKLVYFCQGT